MRFLNLFNAVRPSTSSTLSSGCRPLVKFLKNTLFRENHIVTHETVCISNWWSNFSRFSSTTNYSIGSLSDHRVAPKTSKNASNSLDSRHYFYSKDFHHPTAWCHLPAFMRRSSLLDMDSADSCLSCCESVHFNKFSYNFLSMKASAWRSKTKRKKRL